jgi:hypothetical protein
VVSPWSAPLAFLHNHFTMPATLAPRKSCQSLASEMVQTLKSRSERGLLMIPPGIIAIKVDGICHDDIKVDCRNGLNKG